MKSSCYQFSSCICLILTFMLSESLDCEIPSELRNGAWIHKRPGQNNWTVNFGTTTLQSYTLSVQGTQISDYTCVLNQTLPSNKNILIFRSDQQYFDGGTFRNNRIYLCMKMTKMSDDLFYFFLLNDKQTITSPSERVSTHTDDVTILSDSFESPFCQYDTNNPPDDARILQRQGTSEQLPTCIRLCEPLNATCESVSNCPVVETVSHSTKTTSCGSSGYAITYKCETWYEVTAGNAELTCADNGTWLGTTPTCTLIICKDLKEVPNSTILPDIPTNNINETVTYHCNTGYEHTSGNITRTCKEDKQWSGLPPVCSIVSCPVLSAIINAIQEPSFPSNQYGEVITYTCNTGYELKAGDLTRTCQDDKTWNGTAPECSIISCQGLPVVTNAAQFPPIPTNRYGETITYTCDDWYEVTSGDLKRTCQDDKSWNGTTPECSLITCEDLDEVPNSATSPTSPTKIVNNTVTYSCNTGYEHVSGSSSRMCLIHKKWSGISPVCDPVNCGHLPFVPFTRNTTTGTHYLDNITYTCSQGYIHINGTLSRQCKSDRVWDGIEPTCSKLPSSPDALSNAFVAAAFAGSILFILPFVITCLICNLKDRICRKGKREDVDNFEQNGLYYEMGTHYPTEFRPDYMYYGGYSMNNPNKNLPSRKSTHPRYMHQVN